MFPQALFPLFVALSCNLIAQAAKTIFYYLKSGKWDLTLGRCQRRFSKLPFQYGHRFIDGYRHAGRI